MEKETCRDGRGWLWPALVSAAFVLPGFASGLAPFAGSLAAPARLAAGIAQSLSQFLLLLAIIGVSGSGREFGLRRPRLRDAPNAALGLALLLVAGRAVALAMAAFGPAAGAAPDAAPAGGGAASPGALALALGFSLAVGYREELFYRVYLLGSMRSRGVGPAAAVLVSVSMFAAGHAYQGPWGVLQAALMGLALALLCLRGAGLHALAWAHAAFDLGVLVFGG